MLGLRKKILIRTIVLVCIVLIFAAFFILFKKNIEHQMEIIGTLKSKRLLFSQSASGIVLLKGEWEIARQHTEALREYAPSKDDLVFIPQRLKDIAQAAGVTVSFAYGQELGEKQAESAEAVQFTASVEGERSRIQAFLRSIDLEFRTINTDTLDITTLPSGSLRVSMAGKVQYY